MLRYLALAEWFGPLRILDSITARAALAVIMAFFLALLFGPAFIRHMKAGKACEDVEKPDARRLQELHDCKKGTPTMGGLFLAAAVAITVFLCCDPGNPLVWVGQFTFIGFGALGFLDDLWKLKGWGRKGLIKRHKFLGEIGLALVAVLLLYMGSEQGWFGMTGVPAGDREADFEAITNSRNLIPPTRLVIPFTKWSEVNPDLGWGNWILAMIIIVACSNAVNLTDGLDGLACGCTGVVAMTYALLCYLVGNAMTCAFFRIPMVPGTGELSIFGAALVGGLMGFLWFNANPARVFMGDTGSLALGGVIAFLAIVTKHELTLIVAGGIFVFEALSVILQVAGFRIFHKRLFKIAPFHHHLEYSGWRENHVVVRLWIVGLILSIMSLGLLKMH
ncbi:MAG: phospho-N-acetylmuramoyl-pentapeptide-transferase [Planctomycetota bacterium]|nr:phospho-N-acetylmuramoyl-pentapeptide-transferase [Planctomycetota bacterium]